MPHKPWAFDGGPTDEQIRELVSSGKTALEMTQVLGVSRGTLRYYLTRAGARPPSTRLTHKKYLPWHIATRDSWNKVASGLRAWSAEEQGQILDHGAKSRLRALREHLDRTDRVVHYTREEGWQLVPRDHDRDDPNLPISRPPGYNF